MSIKNELKKIFVCGASLMMITSLGVGINNVSAKRVHHHARTHRVMKRHNRKAKRNTRKTRRNKKSNKKKHIYHDLFAENLLGTHSKSNHAKHHNSNESKHMKYYNNGYKLGEKLAKNFEVPDPETGDMGYKPDYKYLTKLASTIYSNSTADKGFEDGFSFVTDQDDNTNNFMYAEYQLGKKAHKYSKRSFRSHFFKIANHYYHKDMNDAGSNDGGNDKE